MTRPHLLITNDDGIEAPGLLALIQALSDTADLTIVAPQSNQSGVGMAISFKGPLRVKKHPWNIPIEAWSVSGTPADCVKIALHDLVPKKPDLVISGINWGSNAGRSMWWSGTVGATIEAAIQGLPAIAFSCQFDKEPPFAFATPHVPKIVTYFLKNPLPPGTIVNVNFPHTHTPIKGIRMARQGRRYWKDVPEKRTHPNGDSYYWVGLKASPCEEPPEESDIHLLDKGYAAVVPLHIDNLTDHDHLEQHREKFNLTFTQKTPP